MHQVDDAGEHVGVGRWQYAVAQIEDVPAGGCALPENAADFPLDHRPTGEQHRRIGPHRAVQGNLDPAVLFAGWDAVEREVRRILAEGRAARGHVFNLGHGVLPDTDPDVLTRIVDLVHDLTAA